MSKRKHTSENKFGSGKLHLKNGDVVQVLSGKDKNLVGKILKINRKKKLVVVEGANNQTKHQKPKQKNQKGGILKKEGFIHYSSVCLYCKETKRGERIKIVREQDKTIRRIFKNQG